MEVQMPEDLYWRIMDVCTDVEEGLIEKTEATKKIMDIIETGLVKK